MDNSNKVKPPKFTVPPNPYKGKQYTRRWVWLIYQIRKNGYKIGAEIGCHTGMTTMNLLLAVPDLALFAVDLWAPTKRAEGSGQYDNWNFTAAKNKFDTRTQKFGRRLTVLRGLSWEMAEKVNDDSLDFIFIDADHSYESTIKDIRAWTPKLKPGGLLSGHDIHFPTVRAAIDDIVPNWKDAATDFIWYAKKEDALL